MRKKFLALSLAVIVSAAQVMTVSASKQEQLQQQQAAQAETSAQLDNAKAEIDDLETKKNQITGEIDDLDAQLVVTMASVENLKNEIAEKQTEIETTQEKLAQSQAEEDEQYELMKKRIQFLYESGGDNGWAALLLEGKDLSSIRNQAEYTQKLYKYDRECLQEYMDLVQQVTDYSNQLADEKAIGFMYVRVKCQHAAVLSVQSIRNRKRFQMERRMTRQKCVCHILIFPP